MIAQPNSHYESDQLLQLLDDALPEDQVEAIEKHLQGCESCRGSLEQLAGEQYWWNETVDVLSEKTAAANEDEHQFIAHSCAVDASLDWLAPLLTHSSTGGLGSLDQYQVDGVIGQGGMGVVLRAIDPELNRPVAIKVLSPHLAGVGAARARFMREAQAAASVVHPSVVPIYSVVTSPRLPYIVMPCIRGGNLQQRVNREGPLELGEVLRIGVQIAEGLAAAHRRGVIHRDIKPANVLIEDGNGRVLISDFGLARALDDASITISGMIAGTPQFMSPEQARGETIDARSDLFSLGSLLYALATGRPPFRAETPLAVLQKISHSRPKPIHEINEQIPTWVSSLVQHLMHPDISRRVSSAEDATKLLQEADAHVRNPSMHSMPNVPAQLGRRRNERLMIGTVVMALVVMTALAFAGIKGDQDAPKTTRTSPGSASVADHATENPVSPWRDQFWESELGSVRQSLDDLADRLESNPLSLNRTDLVGELETTPSSEIKD